MRTRPLLLTHAPGLTARTRAQTHGVQLHMLDNYNPSNIARTIHDGLKKAGVRTDEVLIRVFNPSRLKQMVETGTDRTGKSKTYGVPASPLYFKGWDATPRVRAAQGIRSEDVTWANRLKWRQEGMPVAWGGLDSKSGWKEMKAPLREYLTELSDGKPIAPEHRSAIALYDSQAITRAPDAEVEYWFKGNPRDALLMVIAPSRAYWERLGTEPELMLYYKEQGRFG